MSGRKIGAGHAQAMARLGLREIRNAFNPSRESVADTELGLYGTQTQGEIAQARGPVADGPEQDGATARSATVSLQAMRDQGIGKGPPQSHPHDQDNDQSRGRDL